MSQLDDVVAFIDNPDPRCPCMLVLDTSRSMHGNPIDELNAGLQIFQSELQVDGLARRRVEVAIVTFGNGGVQPLQEFVTANQFVAPVLSADGNTPMGEAISLALDMLRGRKDSYQRNGIQYYRPWVLLITDGRPTDSWQDAGVRVRQEESQNGVTFFAVGVGNDADMQVLSAISAPNRTPLRLQGLKFRDLFVWLSQSQKRVSGSKVGEQVTLPSINGWGMV